MGEAEANGIGRDNVTLASDKGGTGSDLGRMPDDMLLQRAPSYPDDGGLDSDDVDAGAEANGNQQDMSVAIPSSTGGDTSTPPRSPFSADPPPMLLDAACCSGKDVNEKYHIEPEDIGCGNYGIIRKCRDRASGHTYAVKSIPKSAEECKKRNIKHVSKWESIKREAEILRQVSGHPGIVRLVDTYEDARYLHLVTELCSGGMLFDRIVDKTKKRFTEKEAATLTKSILGAVAYLHEEKNAVHRDIKCENFLFAEGGGRSLSIKLIDFGMSRIDPLDQPMTTSIGTAYYVSPEVLDKSYTKKCDLWSVGVVVYMIICGYYPFYGKSTNQIIKHVKSGKFDYPSAEWGAVSSSAKNFVSSLLTVDPNVRPSALSAMDHPWIVKHTTAKKSLIRSLSKGLKKSTSKIGGGRSKTV
jgi:calcium-dependent protein kinase